MAFCGHATIALGALLSRRFGGGTFGLTLNEGRISVEAASDGRVTLTSPPARSETLPDALRDGLMRLFGLTVADLDPRLPPLIGTAGSRHPIFCLKDRARLAAMGGPFDAPKALMAQQGLTTICLIVAERPDLFHARNAFAIGGVVEDPATGAAAPALAGALVDLDWNGLRKGGAFTIRQGEDMGAPR